MAYKFCPRCSAINRRVSRICHTEGCGYPTIIVNKNMQALAQRFSDCDFNVLAATSSINETSDKNCKSVRLNIEFREYYDIQKVFSNLPNGWSVSHTFSIHDGIVVDDITELTYHCDYYYMRLCTIKDEINTEIDKMFEWISNEGHIACLRLASFWL